MIAGPTARPAPGRTNRWADSYRDARMHLTRGKDCFGYMYDMIVWLLAFSFSKKTKKCLKIRKIAHLYARYGAKCIWGQVFTNYSYYMFFLLAMLASYSLLQSRKTNIHTPKCPQMRKICQKRYNAPKKLVQGPCGLRSSHFSIFWRVQKCTTCPSVSIPPMGSSKGYYNKPLVTHQPQFLLPLVTRPPRLRSFAFAEFRFG